MKSHRLSPTILTVTLNPALDVTTSVERLLPLRKLRCAAPLNEAGGGGVNVSRAIKELGGESRAFVALAGGMDTQFRQLLEAAGVEARYWHCDGTLRFSLTVLERSSGSHYRFVLPGPEYGPDAAEALLGEIGQAIPRECRFVVASGSLPPGMPLDCYARIARLAKSRGARFILDTQGAALNAALSESIFVLRLNLVEVQEIFGDVSLATALPVLARRLIERHDIEILLIGLGDQGTLLTTADEQVQIQPPKVEVLSAVGAGDSFLGALVLALERNWSVEDAVRYGVAAAASAVETEISRLCDRNATEAYFRQISAARHDGVFVSARRT